MTTEKKRCYFITVEGIEGAGKSTAMQTIIKFLQQQQIEFISTREPGGTPLSEKIRDVILTNHTEPMADLTELLLIFASRAQHLQQLIKPNLAKGKWVISDRFTDASYAYQAGGRGMPKEYITILENLVHADLQPDLTLLLDLPVTVALSRLQQRGKLDRIETEQQQFFEQARVAYLQRAKQFPQRFRLINAEQSLEQVNQAIITELKNFVSATH